MAASGDLRQILSPARFNTLPSDMQSILLHVWNTQTGQLKSELEKTKVDAEQKLSVLQKKNQGLEEKLAVFVEENEKGESALSLYRDQATASGARVAKLTEENGKIAAEKDELQRQLQNAKIERDDIVGLSERRQAEIERLHAKIQELTEEVSRAVAGKCEAQARLEDIDAKEMNLTFKQKRLDEEKKFLGSQIQLLQEEVEKRNNEVLTAKREGSIRQIELSQDLEQKTEQLRVIALREEAALKDAETYKVHAEKLTERLREARESEGKLEDNYRAELRSQTKLTDLYRQQGEENTAKTEELTNAVTSLQQMVKETEDKYGKLEAQLETVRMDHKTELEAKQECIQALKKELEDANRLIKTVKDKGLTEDAIEHLSPSAAQASRLLKSGVTLTGIYTQMVSLSEELSEEKEENKRLNSYMDQILVEIEERAPILRQQREDYEQAMAAVGGLNENLEAAREEVDLRRREADEARRGLTSLEKDRDSLEQQRADLSRQIVRLVKEVEAARSGGVVLEPPQTIDIASTESVIEGRLLTFKDVTELQQRNIELLAVVRQLSENREQAESTMIQEKTAEVRQELDTALRQTEELRAARERQQLMVENIIKQRDLYKSMYDSGSSNVGATSDMPQQEAVNKSQPDTANYTEKISSLEKELADVKNEFSEYKQDKRDNYALLERDCQKLRDDLFEARSQAAKLSANEEYNNERFLIAQTNCSSFKKQIETLEMRNKQLDNIAAKHEISISSLREELLKLGRQLSQAEMQVDQLKQENSHLRSVESRLVTEREVLYKEKSSSNQIMANLQQIQINLERNEDQHRIKLQEANEQLSQEVKLLRTKLDDDQEHFKNSVRNWENANKELREKAETSDKWAAQAKEELNKISVTLDTLKSELKEKQEELQLAESRLAGRGQLSSQSSTVDSDGKNRYRDVEILLGKAKQEIKQLQNQLYAEKKKVEEYKVISETSEKRMLESSKAMNDFKNDADNKTKLLENQKAAAEKISEESKSQVEKLTTKIADLEASVGTSGGELRDQLKQKTQWLEEANEKIGTLQAQDKETRERMAALAAECAEAQEKYNQELCMHAKHIETLNQLKTETSVKLSNMDEIQIEKRKMEADVSDMKESFTRQTNCMDAEITALKEQVEVLTEENRALMNQIESVSGQLADVSASAQTLDTSQSQLDISNVSARSGNDGDASRDQLMSIIKYLRREKEIVTGRLEVAQSELVRTARQLEHASKLSQDAESALQIERQERAENLMTAGKHAELIRKVESLAALTDSNRLLRDEKDRLAAIVDTAQTDAVAAKEKIQPLEAKIKELEDKYSCVLVEKSSLQTECDGWRKRSDQLVEKSFKLNPEELKRLQDAETKLNKTVSNLNAEKSKLAGSLSTTGKELSSVKHTLSTAQQEAKKFKEEYEKKVKELKSLSSRETAQKNQLGNLSKQNNDLRKKVDEMEKIKSENTTAINKLKQDLQSAQQKPLEPRVNEENVALKSKLETIEKEKLGLTEELTKMKQNMMNLRKIGRKFRQEAEVAKKELEKAVEEKAQIDEKLKAKQTELSSKDEELKATQDLMKDLDPANIHEMMEKNQQLEEEVTEFRKKETDKENRAKKVLESAKDKIRFLTNKNKELEMLKDASGENTMIEDLKKQIDKAKMEKESMKSALDSTISAIKSDNAKLKTNLEKLKEDKDKQQEQIESLQQELAIATQNCQTKPVAVAGMVHQQETRKQPQPQAHIQPHRHQPREEHRPPQTASIRPMTQRAAAAVVLPTSQVTSGQPEIATVQPTVSVSPSVSSAATPAPQIPSTSQLDPNATEFAPAATTVTAMGATASASSDRSAASSSTDMSNDPTQDESTRGLVSSRMDGVQASTSTPSAAMHGVAQTSTGGSSGNTQTTTASVQPTLKRMRDLETEIIVGNDDQQAGPSGIQQQPKKARTVSSTEEMFVANIDDAESQEIDSDSEAMNTVEQETDNIELVGSGHSAQHEALTEAGCPPGVVTSERNDPAIIDEDGEAFGADADTEEGEISDYDEEEEGEEEEPVHAPDIDVLAEDEAEIEVDTEDADQAALDNPQLLEEEQLAEEENSSEPSSSTGTTTTGVAPQTSQQFQAVATQGAPAGFEQDPAEDSVVPSTPKLAEPRRPDGFSEAVSSPQVPSNERFVFGSSAAGSSSTVAGPDIVVTSTGLMGQEGAERTSFDISQLAGSKEGRPVPGVSPTASPQNRTEEGMADNEEDPAPADVEADDGALRDTEEGVSSSGSTDAPSRPGRKPITWSSSPTGPASTSPQRTLNRTVTPGATQFRSAIRGVGKGRGAKRGGPKQ